MASGLSESRPDHQCDRYGYISARLFCAAVNPNVSLQPPYLLLPPSQLFLTLR